VTRGQPWQFVIATEWPVGARPQSFVVRTSDRGHAETLRATEGRDFTLPVYITASPDGVNRNYHQPGHPLWGWSVRAIHSFPGGTGGFPVEISGDFSELQRDPARWIAEKGDSLLIDRSRVLYEFRGGDTPKVSNVSLRAVAGEGERTLIAGFTITGDGPRTVLIRSLGPSLGQFGISRPLADPVLRLYNGAQFLAQNDDWAQLHPTVVALAGDLRPSAAVEPMQIVTLPPGAYTVQVSGKGGAEGIATIEVFDLDGSD
jgi:hypothetical protein